MILDTSDATGKPKGVVTTHANIAAQITSLAPGSKRKRLTIFRLPAFSHFCRLMVEMRGLEPLASCMRSRRSSS